MQIFKYSANKLADPGHCIAFGKAHQENRPLELEWLSILLAAAPSGSS